MARWWTVPVAAEAVGIHPLIVNSEAVKRVKARYGSALLPQAYPEAVQRTWRTRPVMRPSRVPA